MLEVLIVGLISIMALTVGITLSTERIKNTQRKEKAKLCMQ